MSSVLFINRVYPPLDGATGQLLAELAPALAKEGWQVTVVTSKGSPPVARSEVVDGVRVERVGGLPLNRGNHFLRALSYLSTYPALFWRAVRLPRHDLLVTLTDPPMQVVCGAVLAALKGSKHIHWAQDVYPELAEEMGVLRKGGLLAGMLRCLSTWALRKAEGVVAIGRCMAERLSARGLSSGKIAVIPNWGQSIVTCDSERLKESFRREQGWGGRFVVMYSGNLGLAHSFDTILDSAALMQTSRAEVLFVFVGHGPRLPSVKEQVAARGLANVQFLPFQPKEKLTEVLASADVHLASMRSELCGLVVPSKVYGILAAARPCVFLGPENSEAARLVLERRCGSVLSAATGDSLARCLSEWATDPQLLAQVQESFRTIGDEVGVERATRSFGELFGRALRLQRVQFASSSPMGNESAGEVSAVRSAHPAVTLRDRRWAETKMDGPSEKQDAA